MSMIVTQSKLVGTKDGVQLWLLHLECDTMQDIPAATAFGAGTKIAIGSTAHVIEDNSDLQINSSGVWIQQRAGSSTYTRAEIDQMLAVITATQQAQAAQILWNTSSGVKNILENTAAASQVVAGITWTKNANGTMVATGTSSGVSAVRVVGVQGSSTYDSAVPIPRGQYIISASGFTLTRYRFAIGFFDDANSARQTTNIYNEESILDVTTDTARYDFSCVIAQSGEVMSGEAWYPMIRPAAITDNKYQIYAPTNRQLYDLIKSYHP